jgi:hypothetical protein
MERTFVELFECSIWPDRLTGSSPLLTPLPIWTFGLSTQPPLQTFSPAVAEDPSTRIMKSSLERVDPFYSFSLDVEARRLFIETKAERLALPLESFGEIAHMVTFGRPLWLAYSNATVKSIRPLVKGKLLCAAPKYDPKNVNHVFAVLSHRICLEPCLQRYETVDIERKAVESHLRVIVGFEPKSGYFQTTSQPEPIVSDAAAALLLDQDKRWEMTIESLYNRLMSPGLIPSFVAVLGRQGPTIHSQSNTHPSLSMAATSAAISRTTTTTFCEAIKLTEMTFQRKTLSNQFAASENYRKDKSDAKKASSHPITIR